MEQKIADGVLDVMRDKGGTWAAYQRRVLGEKEYGHLQFLEVGPGCTYAEPPEQYPVDTDWCLGWRYRYIGLVDLVTGAIVTEEAGSNA
jgi:hypothetical protein